MSEASEAGQKQRTVGLLRSQQLGQGRLPLLPLKGQSACHPESICLRLQCRPGITPRGCKLG